MYRTGNEEIEAVARVLRSGDLFKINGGAQEIKHFEDELCEKFGVTRAICMTSGKAALIGMGVGPGDEVIVPAYTYIATATGAIPVIADCDETLTIDPEDIERKIFSHTKAIIPVHIQGFPSAMDRIMEIAKKHKLLVLEDACQSDGGSFGGKRLGTIGDVWAYSFNFFKIITAGEGGALVTDNREIYERALIYHDSSAIAYFGNQLESIESAQFCGTEFRVSEITGAILREQLKRLDGILSDLEKNYFYVKERLSDKYKFAPSHDEKGDCHTTLAFKQKADAAGYGATRPIDTGKHVYTN